MGLNYIVPLIISIIIFVIMGTQITPTYIEKNSEIKADNILLQQDTLKESIIRYISIERKTPKSIIDLKDYLPNNDFTSFDFSIDKNKGILEIYTSLNKGEDYYLNNLKYEENSSKKCLDKSICKNKNNKTTYFIPYETLFETLYSNKIGDYIYSNKVNALNPNVASIAGNGLGYDSCKGGSMGYYAAISYCSNKGMRLPSTNETRAKSSSGVPDCGGSWTWLTGGAYAYKNSGTNDLDNALSSYNLRTQCVTPNLYIKVCSSGYEDYGNATQCRKDILVCPAGYEETIGEDVVNGECVIKKFID